jgi:hypothetical protein
VLAEAVVLAEKAAVGAAPQEGREVVPSHIPVGGSAPLGIPGPARTTFGEKGLRFLIGTASSRLFPSSPLHAVDEGREEVVHHYPRPDELRCHR